MAPMLMLFVGAMVRMAKAICLSEEKIHHRIFE